MEQEFMRMNTRRKNGIGGNGNKYIGYQKGYIRKHNKREWEDIGGHGSENQEVGRNTIKKGKISKVDYKLIGQNMREKERNRREQEGLLKQKDKKN